MSEVHNCLKGMGERLSQEGYAAGAHQGIANCVEKW